MDLPDSPPTVLCRREVAAKLTDSHNVGSSSRSDTTTATTASSIMATSSSSSVPFPHTPLSLQDFPTASTSTTSSSTASVRRRTSTLASNIAQRQTIKINEQEQLQLHVPVAKRTSTRGRSMENLAVDEDCSSKLLMPPSKFKRTGRERDMSKIPLYRTKRTSSDTGKQASICQQLFPNHPPTTAYPSPSASSTSATTTAISTHLLSTATFYSRGRAVSIKPDIPIDDPFRQPKREILELEEEMNTLATTTTATTSASDSSSTVINPEVSISSPSPLEQQGFQQESPITDVEGGEEISLYSVLEGIEPHDFDKEEEQCDLVDFYKTKKPNETK